MIHSQSHPRRPGVARQCTLRYGVSLLEVISCTALVVMLMVPMAGVLRSSGQAIRQSEGLVTAAQALPKHSLALQHYVRDCEAILKYAEDILVVMRQGEVIYISVIDSQLVAQGGKQDEIIADGIERVRFENEVTSLAGEIHAISATLEAPDAESWTIVLAIDR